MKWGHGKKSLGEVKLRLERVGPSLEDRFRELQEMEEEAESYKAENLILNMVVALVLLGMIASVYLVLQEQPDTTYSAAYLKKGRYSHYRENGKIAHTIVIENREENGMTYSLVARLAGKEIGKQTVLVGAGETKEVRQEFLVQDLNTSKGPAKLSIGVSSPAGGYEVYYWLSG